ATAPTQTTLRDAMQKLYAANGVDTDLELALFDLDHDRDVAAALARAKAEQAQRPSIKADDTLAWGLYKTGDCAAAQAAATRPMRLGPPDPLTLPAVAAAHPLGNFTVNHYSRLEPTGDRLRVTYILDMAEIPTLQEQQDAIDANGDGQASQQEQDAYAARKADELRRNLTLSV